MILIEKKSEPACLREYRKIPGAKFDDMEKTELRNFLLEEQGYICAYCMKRIRRNSKVKIEHYIPRTPENELLYKNLLAVCDGNETLVGVGGKVDRKRFTCDTMKKKRKLCINPQSLSDMETIYYDAQGKIYSTNSTYQNEIDEILNLNDPYGYLVGNRKAALKSLMGKLGELRPGQDARPLLKKLEIYCESKNEQQEYPQYAGILRWYIKRQIRKHGGV